jgi:hypothetical protein
VSLIALECRGSTDVAGLEKVLYEIHDHVTISSPERAGSLAAG